MSKIGFHGTSISLGARPGVFETDTFAYRVFQGRGFDGYFNTGVGGNTSAQMAARFAADIIAKQPTHVCIEIPHINDYYGNIPCPVTESNVAQMVAAALGAGIKTTLINHQLVRDSNMINAMQPRLEASWRLSAIPGVAFADCWQDFVWRYFVTNGGPTFDALYAMNGSVMDPQHPSALGHAAMASRILANPRACSLAN